MDYNFSQFMILIKTASEKVNLLEIAFQMFKNFQIFLHVNMCIKKNLQLHELNQGENSLISF